MALTFVYGNAGNGKSEIMYQQFAAMAESAPYQRFFVVVPEQFTMSAQKSLVAHAKGGVILNIDVVSFERLAYRVFDERGIHRAVMEETGKSLVLRRIVEKQESRLTFLKRNITKMGYITELKSVLSELMQYGVSPDDLEELIREVKEESSLAYKLRDLLAIYRAFDDYLAENYVTAERVLDVLTEVAGESALLKDAVFLFDGYTGFTPVQMTLLSRLMGVAKDLYVTVTLDVREPLYAPARMEDLFYMSHKMINALLAAAKEAQFAVAEPLCIKASEKSRFAGNPVLASLEEHLFRVPTAAYDESCGDCLHVTSLLSARDELTYAAATIHDLVRRKGYRYRDFAIVCSDVETYVRYADSVFTLYDIPAFVDQKQTILYHPLTELLRAAVDLAATDYARESVFRLLRTGLAGFANEEIDLLENYCIANGIRGARRWRQPFDRIATRHGRVHLLEEDCLTQLACVNALRERFVALTWPLVEAFRSREATVRTRTEALYNLLKLLDAERTLRTDAERFENEGDEKNAAVNQQIYKIVIDLFDKMVDLLGDEVVSSADYAEILEAGFAAARVGRIPPGSDCVLLGDIERTRTDNVKVLFFLGVNDGQIPKKAGRMSLLSQHDREVIKACDVTLAPDDREQVFLQRFYLYLALTKPSEALYLTCSRLDTEGKTIRPSYLIGEVKKLFPALRVTESDAHPVLPLVTAKSSLGAYLTGLADAESEPPSREWKALHRWYETHAPWGERTRRLLDAHFYVHGTEHLSPELAKALYGAVLHNSVTRLESFSACPFAHYLQYGLALSPRDEMVVDALGMGTLFHDALCAFGTRLEETTTWSDVTEDESDALLEEALRDVMDAQRSELYAESASNEYTLTRVRRILKSSIRALTEQIRRGDFRPAGYEIPFEEEEGETRAHLTGRVDRMDVCETDDAVYVRVIDYKSGAKDVDLEQILYGREFQLPLYLDTAMRHLAARYPDKEVVPAGIFYLHLDDPMAEKETEPEEVEREIFAKFKLKGLINADPAVCRRMDKTVEEGSGSDVVPFRVNKTGAIGSSDDAVSAEALNALMDYVRAYTDRAAEAMLAGEMEIKPYHLGNYTGCDYCDCRGVCGFDLRIPGYGYREEEKPSNEEMWKRIYEGTDDSDDNE